MQTHPQPAQATTKPCAACGEPITARRPWQRFCSQKCRNSYHNIPRQLEALTAKIDALTERVKELESLSEVVG